MGDVKKDKPNLPGGCMLDGQLSCFGCMIVSCAFRAKREGRIPGRWRDLSGYDFGR